MHTYIFEHENSVSFLDSMLLNGIRDMGGNPDSIAMIKSQIKSGIIQGPDIFLTGYTFDSEKDRSEPDSTTIIVGDFTNLEKIVDKLHGLNVDFIKVHNYFPHYRLEELIQIASQRDLRVVGHIPYGTGPHEAINLGMYSIEHVNSFIGSLVTTEGNDVNTITQAFTTLDSSYVSELSQLMVNNHTAFTPTLHIINKGYQSSGDENSRKLGGLMMDRFLPMVKSMNDQGVLLLAGSDDVPINEENYGAIHKEIEWLVKAGLSNLEALQTATINPAKFLKIENEYGSIEVNKKANLIILNNNPIENISFTKDIDYVIKKGVLYK